MNCLDGIYEVVNKSAVSVNVSQLCASQKGETIEPVFDWSSYLFT